MKNLAYSLLIVGFFSASCSKKGQCPAYMDHTQATLSIQDKDKMTPGEIHEQSKKLLDSQGSYIVVERDKKTGLVKSKKRVKKGKNNATTHKGFSNDPRTLKGVK
jgi:thiamine phosphate synthase YjbQ (UPF0047 family)